MQHDPSQMQSQSAQTDLQPAAAWWRHRACWFWAVSPLLVYLLSLPNRDSRTIEIWANLNGALLLIQFLWALRHITTLWRIRGTILRWSPWAALLIAFPMAQAIDEGTNEFPIPTGAIYLILVLLVLPIAAAFGVLLGVAGAGNGMLASPSTDRLAGARSGVRWWWAVLLPIAFYYLISPDDRHACVLLLIGLPWIGFCLQPLLHLGRRFEIIGRLNLWLAPKLRLKLHGRSLDLRAAFFSSIGFLLAWALIGTKIFTLLQASYLVSNIQMMDSLKNLKERPWSREIVILEWDSAARRMAMESESETVIMTRLLQRFAGLGALRIVMMDPSEDFGQLNLDSANEPINDGDAPAMNPKLREFEELESAIRATGNVMLLTRESPPSKPGSISSRLQRVARESAPARLQSFRSSPLPLIPFKWDQNQIRCAPLALYAARHPTEAEAMPVVSADRTATFHGRKFPLIDRESNLLVPSNFEEEIFPRVSCSDVLRGEAQFQPGNVKTPGEWMAPERFFRDKIVFIPPFKADQPRGPLREIDSTLMLAHATNVLFANHFLGTLPPPAEIGIAFACALLVGAMTMRRDPLKAGWRMLLVLVGILFGSLGLFVFNIWLDPFLAMTSSIASFLLVTQLSFSLERAAKNRHRTLLHRFVDPIIANELLDSQESRIGLGGNRENVVILFADVRGFSQFAERHSPEDVMRVVNDYLGVMTDVLHAHGGLLDKYTGDGLMAMFRTDRVGSVVGAVDAALAMRNAVLELSRGMAEEGDKPLGVGISIHTGEAVVGLIGNSQHQVNFTAFGHTVVVASRLQSVADGGEVIVSEAVYEAVRGHFQIEPRPAVIVKGISEPVQPYLVRMRNLPQG